MPTMRNTYQVYQCLSALRAFNRRRMPFLWDRDRRIFKQEYRRYPDSARCVQENWNGQPTGICQRRQRTDEYDQDTGALREGVAQRVVFAMPTRGGRLRREGMPTVTESLYRSSGRFHSTFRGHIYRHEWVVRWPHDCHYVRSAMRRKLVDRPSAERP